MEQRCIRFKTNRNTKASVKISPLTIHSFTHSLTMFLNSLPYHLKVRDHFRQQSKTWDFFAAANNKVDQLEQYKTGLLKNTYKFDPAADKHIYNAVDTAKAALSLTGLPVTVYQAQYTDELNASIIFLNSEAHIVFSGRIISLLDEKELLGILAHELAHVKLYSMLDGDLEIADRIIHAIANNYQTEAAYYETARLYRLYTEIFCDRGAYVVLEQTAPVISGLVKAATGLEKVSADAYLKQTEEILANGNIKDASFSHPENYIRAKALQLWHQNGEAAETAIIEMIEGSMNIDQLDIFKQQELSAITRTFLQLFLKPKWFQSTMVISQAKNYFADFRNDENVLLLPGFSAKISGAHSSIKEYLCYVLLDFVLIDPMLEEIPFGWAFQFSEYVFLKETFEAIVKKELKFSDKKIQQHRNKTLSAFNEVKENEGEQIYE